MLEAALTRTSTDSLHRDVSALARVDEVDAAATTDRAEQTSKARLGDGTATEPEGESGRADGREVDVTRLPHGPSQSALRQGGPGAGGEPVEKRRPEDDGPGWKRPSFHRRCPVPGPWRTELYMNEYANLSAPTARVRSRADAGAARRMEGSPTKAPSPGNGQRIDVGLQTSSR